MAYQAEHHNFYLTSNKIMTAIRLTNGNGNRHTYSKGNKTHTYNACTYLMDRYLLFGAKFPQILINFSILYFETMLHFQYQILIII